IAKLWSYTWVCNHIISIITENFGLVWQTNCFFSRGKQCNFGMNGVRHSKTIPLIIYLSSGNLIFYFIGLRIDKGICIDCFLLVVFTKYTTAEFSLKGI